MIEFFYQNTGLSELSKTLEQFRATSEHWQSELARACRSIQLIDSTIHPAILSQIDNFFSYKKDIDKIITPLLEAQRTFHLAVERHHAELDRSSLIIQESYSCIRNGLEKQFLGIAEIFAPIAAEQRVRQGIIKLGFVPHAVLFEHLSDVEAPSIGLDEFSQQLAHDIWPKIKPLLELAIEDCIGDQKIFLTFAEIITAHEAGLYQLTISNAFSVVERAARLAQPGPQKKKTYDWLKDGLGGFTIYEVPPVWRRGWLGVWAVLYKEAFGDVRTDEVADGFQFPHRHASAHGLGAKINNVLDSLNGVLLTHFVITAASTFLTLAQDES